MTLCTVGPTPLTPEILRAMDEPMPYHRGDAFRRIHRECLDGLRRLFRTEGEAHILTSSGTGAMEAAVTNLFSPGEKVLTVNGGKFGERWGKICRAYGLEVVEAEVEWGAAIASSDLARLLRAHPGVRGVFLTHCETSTGALTDLRSAAAAIRDAGEALIVADAVASLGAHALEMDGWGLDCVIAASQKALRLPPGLAFIALGARAVERSGRAALPRFYFDLRQSRDALRRGDTPWTPAITLIQGLAAALNAWREPEMERIRDSFRICAGTFRAGIRGMGLETMGRPPADSMTAVRLPAGIRDPEFRGQLLQRHGIIVSGGQGKLAGEIVRVSHMGDRDFLSILAILEAFEDILGRLGFKSTPGEAGKAAAANYRPGA